MCVIHCYQKPYAIHTYEKDVNAAFDISLGYLRLESRFVVVSQAIVVYNLFVQSVTN